MKEKSVSGIRESNPPFKLGKLAHYRCANSAFRADTRTRTEDLFITNELLYQLSHIGNSTYAFRCLLCKGISFFLKDQIYSFFSFAYKASNLARKIVLLSIVSCIFLSFFALGLPGIHKWI